MSVGRGVTTPCLDDRAHLIILYDFCQGFWVYIDISHIPLKKVLPQYIECSLIHFLAPKSCAKSAERMAHSENLGLGKTHTPKLVASLLRQLVSVPTAPSSLASKFLLLLPNARGFGQILVYCKFLTSSLK